jgi:hypothetical protein
VNLGLRKSAPSLRRVYDDVEEKSKDDKGEKKKKKKKKKNTKNNIIGISTAQKGS